MITLPVVDSHAPPVCVMAYCLRLFYLPHPASAAAGRPRQGLPRLALGCRERGRGLNAKLIADALQRLRQRAQRQVLASGQHVAQHVFRQAGRLAKRPPRPVLQPDQLLQFGAIVGRPNQTRGNPQAAALGALFRLNGDYMAAEPGPRQSPGGCTGPAQCGTARFAGTAAGARRGRRKRPPPRGSNSCRNRSSPDVCGPAAARAPAAGVPRAPGCSTVFPPRAGSDKCQLLSSSGPSTNSTWPATLR
jgi:hypothetical protein